ncbi:MAG TPA: TIGR04255 family protein [Bdellovibrionota bacterium]|nr:TIGR04255 family protein [Bdellovibrionota bacterium]
MSKAPIQEAVIDFQIKPFGPDVLSSLEALHEQTKEAFPIKEPLARVEASMSIHAEQGVHDIGGKSERVGILCRSASGNEVVQFRRDGFAYSLLKPYSDWGSFVQKAKELWDKYKKTLPEARISRLGVRNINILELPPPGTKLTEYFHPLLSIPKDLPKTVRQLFTRVELPFDNDIRAAVVQAFPTGDPVKPSYLIDIDTFRVFPEPGLREEDPWATINEFRLVKNRIFFAIISKKTERLLK